MIPAHDWRVSRLAIDTATGRVAGVCLCEVTTADRPSQTLEPLATHGTEACRLVAGFLSQLGEGYDVFKALGVEKLLYMNIVVVDKR